MLGVRVSVLVMAATLLCSVSYAAPPQEALDLQEAFVRVSEEVGPSVVSISTEHTERYRTAYNPFSQFEDEFFEDFFKDFYVTGPEREFKRIGLGSGVIIDKDGHVLTNEHVIHGAEKITVTLPDGREFDGQLTGSDIRSDLAVIKIDSKAKELPFARLGDSDKVRIGHWAIAIGNPFAFAVRNPEPTVTVGVVSALNRSLPRTNKRAREYTDLIQTDAAINPGNSGGPLLNIHGEVIGINVAIFTLSGGSEGVGFAVPVNTARKIMEDLIEGRDVLYGWVGVVIQDIDSDLAEYFGLKSKQGALISKIIKNSPAEKAGLRSGDIIVSFDNERVRDTQDLIRRVLKKDIGDKVMLGIVRDRRSSFVNVEIGARIEEQIAEAPREDRKANATETEEAKYWRGIEVSDITPEIASRYKISVESGVIVINVTPLSPAATAGIRTGDVIYEINKIPIKNTGDYKDVIKKVSGDALVKTYRGYVLIKAE